MTIEKVRIVAPSRIHFGLLALSKNSVRRYGGAGVVVEQPRLVLEVTRGELRRETGPLAARVREFVETWAAYTGLDVSVRCDVLEAPEQHVGLGLGTQLGLSVARALDHLYGRHGVSLVERAASVGRGRRSAVGAYGFTHGGLIVEDGKAPQDVLGRLQARVALPPEWRLLLIRLRGIRGLAGEAEHAAFDDGLNTHFELERQLHKELFAQLLPTAQRGDFDAFSESVHQYGRMAGEYFAPVQHGPFLSKAVAELVSFCRANGVAGVGQSSWGPTVYCWFADETAAKRFAHLLSTQPNFSAETMVTSVCRSGAGLYALD